MAENLSKLVKNKENRELEINNQIEDSASASYIDSPTFQESEKSLKYKIIRTTVVISPKRPKKKANDLIS